MGYRYVCPMRWADMDAQGHVNNAAFVDYLQEARVDYLLSGPPQMKELLDTGVLVVQHQVEYPAPLIYHDDGVVIDLWVDAVGASRFSLGYEVTDRGRPVARARTAAAPFDLAAGSLRRLRDPERTVLLGALDPSEPLPPLPKVRSTAGGHHYELMVRWSDLDSYGHVNNVKYFDYIQEARIALLVEALGWLASDDPEVWAVVRQDLDYVRPIDFRAEPYAVRTVVSDIGNRSVRTAADIIDPTTGTVFAAARTILVGPSSLTDGQRSALGRWAMAASGGPPRT